MCVVETREPDGQRKALVQLPEAAEPMGWVSMSSKEGKVMLLPPLMSVEPAHKDGDKVREMIVRDEAHVKATEVRRLTLNSRVHVLETSRLADGATWAKVALEKSDLAAIGWVVQVTRQVADTVAGSNLVMVAGSRPDMVADSRPKAADSRGA